MTSQLEAQVEPASASQRSIRPRCREQSGVQLAGAFTWTGTGSQSCHCLAMSTPCTGWQTELTTKRPSSFLLTFWEPSGRATDREGVPTMHVCWSLGWVWLGSGAQGKKVRPPGLSRGKEVRASWLWACALLGSLSP